MDNSKKISVIVPVYNAAKYLETTLDHIVNQTYKNLEIILVDDGSTDESGSICDSCADSDPRVRVIHKENGGSSSARNVGIEAATGDYIGFLDADDYAEYTMYEKLLSVCVSTGCDIAQCLSLTFDEEGNLVDRMGESTGTVTFIPSKEDFRLLMSYKGDSSMCTKLVKASFCKRFSFVEHYLNEDFRLMLEMLQQTNGVYTLGEPLYNIINHHGSNQRSGFRHDLYDAIIINSDYAYSLMESLYPDTRTETEYFRYVQRLQYLLHIPVKEMSKDNEICMRILREIRDERNIWSKNQLLDAHQLRNLKILSTVPYLAKFVHKLIMKLKNI